MGQSSYRWWTRLAVVSVYLACCISASTSAATVSLQNPVPDGDCVAVSVTVAADGNDQIASLQFDLGYDNNNFELADVQQGGSAADAWKEVVHSLMSPDTIRVIVAGLNQNVIPDGPVMTMRLRPLHEDASLPALALHSVVISDPFGGNVDVKRKDSPDLDEEPDLFYKKPDEGKEGGSHPPAAGGGATETSAGYRDAGAGSAEHIATRHIIYERSGPRADTSGRGSPASILRDRGPAISAASAHLGTSVLDARTPTGDDPTRGQPPQAGQGTAVGPVTSMSGRPTAMAAAELGDSKYADSMLGLNVREHESPPEQGFTHRPTVAKSMICCVATLTIVFLMLLTKAILFNRS